MLTSFSEFKLTFTTLLLTVLVPAPMELIRLERGDWPPDVLTFTPSFLSMVLTLFVFMLMPPASVRVALVQVEFGEIWPV